MEKYLDITKPLYREQILPVPTGALRYIKVPLYIGMQGKKWRGLVQNRVEKSGPSCSKLG